VDIRLQSSVAKLTADGESRAILTATVTDSGGKGLEKLPVVMTAAPGNLGPVSDQGGGRYQAELVAPLGGAAACRVSASLGGQVETLTLPMVAPEPVSVSVAPPRLTADGTSVAKIAVRAFGPDGASGAKEVVMESDLGHVPGRVRLDGTRAEAVFRAGTRAGRAHLLVRVGPASAHAEIEILPGPPARLTLSASADEVLADGAHDVDLTAEVLDAHGNPVPDALPVLTASVGRLGPPRAQGAGRTSVVYRPPAEGSGQAIIRAAVASEVSDEIRIRLRAPPRRFGVAVSAGIEHNLARIGAPLAALEGSFRLSGSLFLLAGAGYFGNEIDAATPDGPSGGASTLRLDAVPLWVGVAYRFENGSIWTPTIRAGAAAVISRVEARPSFQDAIVERGVQPAGFVRAGVEMGLGPGGVLLEIGYLLAPWLGSEVVTGRLGGLSGRLGYRFAF
jgi:hypothetical protein